MEDKRRKSILFMTIILILAIIVITVVVIVGITISNFFKDKADERDNTDWEIRDEAIQMFEEKSGKTVKVSSIVDFNTVKVCIQKFYSYYTAMYDQNIINGEYGENLNLDYYKENTYNLLSEEYCTKNEITLENINSKLPELKGELIPEIYEIYYLTYDQNVKLYFVTGVLRDNSNSIPFSINVYMDTINNYFKIDLDNLVGKEYKELTAGEEMNITLPTEIEKSGFNKYAPVSSSYEDFCRMTFDNIIKLMVYNTDMAYELLDNNGKTTFATSNDLKTFVNNNKMELLLLTYKLYENYYENGKLSVKLYDKNSTYEFKVTFDEFSSFVFSFEKI